ncbi:hypothetical protein MTO96_011993 [Rhipicephalus appendiculatus]
MRGVVISRVPRQKGAAPAAFDIERIYLAVGGPLDNGVIVGARTAPAWVRRPPSPPPIRAAARSPGRKHVAPAASASYLGRATLAGVAGRFLGLRVAAALATLRRALHFARGRPAAAAWGTPAPAAYFGSPGPVPKLPEGDERETHTAFLADHLLRAMSTPAKANMYNYFSSLT